MSTPKLPKTKRKKFVDTTVPLKAVTAVARSDGGQFGRTWDIFSGCLAGLLVLGQPACSTAFTRQIHRTMCPTSRTGRCRHGGGPQCQRSGMNILASQAKKVHGSR